MHRRKDNNLIQFAKNHKLFVACIFIYIITIVFIILYKMPSAHNITGNAVDKSYSENQTLSYNLPSLTIGVYTLHVEYSSEYDTTSSNEAICNLSIDGGNGEKYESDIVYLEDYKSSINSRIWITSLSSSVNMNLNINFTGEGVTNISDISIYEYTPWRFGFLIGLAIILSIICSIYYVFRKASPYQRLAYIATAAVLIFASYPALYGDFHYLWGDDYIYHSNRIASIANEISYGHFPALYQSDSMHGAGYIALLMYGNLFLYIPALMYLLGLPLTSCCSIFTILVNAVTLAITYYCCKRIFKDPKYAFLGACLYTLSSYRITNVFLRAAMGEYLAMTFIPLVIYGFYRIYFKEERLSLSDLLPLILGLSGILESHMLSLEMMAWFVLIFIIVYIKKTIMLIKPLVISAIIFMLLNAFFIVPFLDTYSQPLIINSVESSENINVHGAYFPQLFSIFMTGNSGNFGDTAQGEMPLTLGLTLIIGIILFLIVVAYNKTWIKTNADKKRYKLALLCFAFALLSLYISSIYFPWQELSNHENAIIKLFTAVQYPWRFLTYASAFMVFITVYSIKVIVENTSAQVPYLKKTLVLILAFFSVIVIGDFYRNYIDTTYPVHYLSNPTNTFADVLYLPKEAPGMLYNTNVTCSPEGAASITRIGTDNSNNKVYRIDNTYENCTITLPIFYYDYITATDQESGDSLDKSINENGQLSVNLTAGYSGTIIISYSIRTMWKVAYIVSALSILSIILFYLFVSSSHKNKSISS